MTRGWSWQSSGTPVSRVAPKPAYAFGLAAPALRVRARPSVRVVVPVVADVRPPVTLFVSETVQTVSLQAGFTTTQVTWSADEDCQAWQIRDVTGAAGQTVADGVLVASGGAITANAQQVTSVAGGALSAGDGAKTLKLFAQDLAGNWTT